MTPGARATLESIGADPMTLLRRHQSGDWQDMSRDDQAANSNAIKHGDRVFTSNKLTDAKIRVWVITEADRSSTTILLPEEY